MTDPVAGADQARHPALSHVPRPMGWYRDGAGSLVTGYLMSPHEVANVWEAALAALPAPVAGAECLEVRRLLGYLWTATGYRNDNLCARDLFREDDPIVADVERLAIFPGVSDAR